MNEMNWWNQPQQGSGGTEGPGDATQPVPVPTDPTCHHPRGRGKALRWTVGVAAAVVIAAGGTIAGIDMTHSGSAQGGQGAVLSAALDPTDGTVSSNGAAGHTAASGQADGVRFRHVARILRHLRGIHGEFTVRKRDGGFRQIAFERGVIIAVNDKNVTVRAADGTTWVWTLTSKTSVVKNRAKATPSTLATGDRLFVGGPESGSVRDARLIFVPKNQGKGQSRPGSGSSPRSSSSAS